jgi:hypothetical protein
MSCRWTPTSPPLPGEVWEAAERFYLLLKPLLGTNAWVTTSKLCARKRPRFFPAETAW